MPRDGDGEGSLRFIGYKDKVYNRPQTPIHNPISSGISYMSYMHKTQFRAMTGSEIDPMLWDMKPLSRHGV